MSANFYKLRAKPKLPLTSVLTHSPPTQAYKSYHSPPYGGGVRGWGFMQILYRQ